MPAGERGLRALAMVWMLGAAFMGSARAEAPAEISGRRDRPVLPSAEAMAALPPDGGPEFNRLIFEKSPYLLQHARNPIDWYPWGPEAFAKAEAEDRPVFLSIGYSTCHWCHVMERESFEDEDVASAMNAGFVAIKVDREERPDLDHLYMKVTRAMTGTGGWPMTVIMGPDKVPFFAGTYFPRTGRLGRPGVMEILAAVTKAWRDDRASLEATAQQVVEFLEGEGDAPDAGLAAEGGETPGAEAPEAAFTQLRELHDEETGGFGRAPKFPAPHHLMFLLRYASRTGEEEATRMAAATLRAMRAGGVFDHVGFGFHRYSTDREWLVPHFEKMLYDQAMLTMAYTEGYLATGEEEFARTAREILTYVTRDMTAAEGGFYSAEDADSEGEEGRFYLWTEDDVRRVLGKAEGGRWMQVHGFETGGNYLDEVSRERTGRNIPHRDRSNEEWAEAFGMEPAAFETWLEAARGKLFDARERRVHPLKDDKILTDWNGLMIAALSKAGRALEEPAYAKAATRAADFALAKLRGADGRLMKRYRGGEAGLEAHLDDYAFLAWGLIEVYEATFEPRYLEAAVELTEQMLAEFGAEAGGFYFAAEGAEDLIARPRELFDGAIPAGNSVVAMNLLRLARMTGRTAYEERVDAMLRSIAVEIGPQPASATFLMSALDFAVGPSFEIVIAGEAEAEDTREMIAALNRQFLPNAVVLLRTGGEAGERIAALAPFTEAQGPMGGRATAYVCENFACDAPTNEVGVMLASLKSRRTERIE